MTREYLGSVKLGSVASMTKKGRWVFLERHHEIAVSSVDAEGVIYCSPVWYTIIDQRIFLPIDQASKHFQNVEGGSKLTGAVFAGGEELCTARGVQIQGQGRLVNDPTLRERCMEQLVEKIFGFGHPHRQTYIEYRETFDKMTLELIPDKMITWDLRKTYNLPMYTSRRL